MYKVITCGVNQGPSSERLSFAEKDALNIADLFRGGLGPVDDNGVHLLTGEEATVARIQQELTNLASSPPTFLMFYFSGHGSQDGILASDGLLYYAQIIQCLQLINAPHTMVILDVCSAASYLEFLKRANLSEVIGALELSWLDALAQATPGTRLIFSTGAGRKAREGAKGIENSNFTYALLISLRKCLGDIELNGKTWISDQKAFAATTKVLRTLLEVADPPVERGLTGDFPLILSQARDPVGEAYFASIRVQPDSLDLTFTISERRLVKTKLRWSVVNIRGMAVAEGQLVLAPDYTETMYTHSLPCPHDAIRRDPVSQLQIIRFHQTTLDWILLLQDENGNELANKVVPVTWSR